MATPTPVSSLDQLQQLFPGVLMIDSGSLAGVVGIAYKTLNNIGDAFPIRPVRFGRRKYYRLIDIAAYIDSELGISTPSVPPAPTPAPVIAAPAPRRQRGRPRKVGV